MKLKNILPALTAVTMFCSCQDWLDIQPKTEIKQDKMFETESGFKNALIGAYMLMTDSMTYGREMNITFMDVLGQQYELFNTGKYYYAKFYDYVRFQNTIDNLWIKNYRTIANLNALLEALETKKNILHPTNYAVIKGEAHGLRAFLHLDLFRMFGYGDCISNPSNLDKLSIPYVEKYSKYISEQLTGREVLKRIHADLKIAEDILSYYGAYSQVPQDADYELPNEDKFHSTPQSRFNYWAVKATQARAYMWEGKYEEALKCVSGFIDGTTAPFKWVDPNKAIHVELKDQDLTFSVEHIFYLNVSKLYQSLRPFVESYKIYGDFSSSDNTDYFYISKVNVDALYEANIMVGASDYRYMRWFDPNEDKNKILKFYQTTDTKSASEDKVPLIRKSEMFYYAAECYNELNQPGKAVDYLNQVRVARGILFSHNLPSSLSKSQIDQEIEKEWRKEFISEGQMFFYYKRLGKTIPNSTGGTGDNVFVFPMPKQEIEIGGREDYK